jgi:hypothetical protein
MIRGQERVFPSTTGSSKGLGEMQYVRGRGTAADAPSTGPSPPLLPAQTLFLSTLSFLLSDSIVCVSLESTVYL